MVFRYLWNTEQKASSVYIAVVFENDPNLTKISSFPVGKSSTRWKAPEHQAYSRMRFES